MAEIKVFESNLSVAQRLPLQTRVKVDDHNPKDIKLFEEYLNVKKDILVAPKGKKLVGVKMVIVQIVESEDKVEERPQEEKAVEPEPPKKLTEEKKKSYKK